MWDDEEEDYDLAPQQERGGRQRQSHILDEDGLPVDNTPSISVEETIIQDEKKHRALVSRVIREGKGRGPLAKRIRYQLKFDDENYVEDIVSDCSLFRFVEGIRDGDPLRLILMPGRQALWEVDAVEAEAIRTRKLAQESLERKTRFTLDADRLTSPIGLRVLREEFPLIQLARTKGSEANDVRAMVNAYRLWAQRLHPNMHFRRVLRRCGDLMATRPLGAQLATWREAQQREVYRELRAEALGQRAAAYAEFRAQRLDNARQGGAPQSTADAAAAADAAAMAHADAAFADMAAAAGVLGSATAAAPLPQPVAASSPAPAPSMTPGEVQEMIERNKKAALERRARAAAAAAEAAAAAAASDVAVTILEAAAEPAAAPVEATASEPTLAVYVESTGDGNIAAGADSGRDDAAAAGAD